MSNENQNQTATVTETNDALLPCPFCGKPPSLKVGKVKCVNNQCKVQPKTSAWYVRGYEQNAVKDWNERSQANDQSQAQPPTAVVERKEDNQ